MSDDAVTEKYELDRKRLANWLTHDKETQKSPDAVASEDRFAISNAVVRAIWEGEHTAAIACDAASTAAGTVTDLLKWHATATGGGADRDRVTLIVSTDRSEVLDALRTMRTAYRGDTKLRVLVAAGETVTPRELDGEAPDFANSPRVQEWGKQLGPWPTTEPDGLALELIRRLDPASLRLYPILTDKLKSLKWSLRLRGLEIAEVSATTGYLGIKGTRNNAKAGTVRAAWNDLCPNGRLPFATTPRGKAVSLEKAIEIGQRFIAAVEALRRDRPISEHDLESQVLGGAMPVVVDGTRLSPVVATKLRPDLERHVCRGSQFPTLWGDGEPRDGERHTVRPRFLDALLRDGEVPWAVELKIRTGGGSGAYLRHGIAQAVLYRHFIRTATPVHPWFEAFGLDAKECRAVVAFPKGTDATEHHVGKLQDLASQFDVKVVDVPDTD